ncbi:hypothetical protein EVA_16257 [gut metagenome]|uniref:Uncharacterized protein n=1 Tax=gut metagenome TaxID=749906 RepID=J9C725_9ZZZZ
MLNYFGGENPQTPLDGSHQKTSEPVRARGRRRRVQGEKDWRARTTIIPATTDKSDSNRICTNPIISRQISI